MALYGLQTRPASATEIIYTSPATPAPVPGSPGCYGLSDEVPCSSEAVTQPTTTPSAGYYGAQAEELFAGCSSPTSPAFVPNTASTYEPSQISSACSCLLSISPTSTASALAATTTATQPTSVCTTIAGSSPTATYPAFCHPSLHKNAVSISNDSLPTATVTVGAVTNKMDCCASCVGIFNCVWWKFEPAFTGQPTEKLPGGFDPWGRGDCVVGYHIGDRNAEVVGAEPPAAVCPNGMVGEILATNGGQGGHGWSNVYWNGFNEGPCAAASNVFVPSSDVGYDKSGLCPPA